MSISFSCKFGGMLCYIMGIISLFLHNDIFSDTFHQILMCFLGFALLNIGTSLYRYGQKAGHLSLEEKLNEDSRPPILYLRNFNRDGQEISQYEGLLNEMWKTPREYFKSRMSISHEEELVNIFELLGPVIALGKPDETKIMLGASRTVIGHEEWKNKIIDLINKCRYFIVVLDFSISIKWEIGQIVKANKLDNTIFIIPDYIQNEYWLELYNEFKKKFQSFPDLNANTVAFCIESPEYSHLIMSSSEYSMARLKTIENYVRELLKFEKDEALWLRLTETKK